MAIAGPKYETYLASEARTATPTKVDKTVPKGVRGMRVTIDATAVTATPSLTCTIQAKDAVSGKYSTLLASTAIATISTTTLLVYPDATAAANLVANLPVGSIVAIDCVHGDADSITYSVAIDWLV